MTADASVPPATTGAALRWRTVDGYHARSDCGRYSVARKTVNGVDWYIAYRLTGDGSARADELDAETVDPQSTDEHRRDVIRRMKSVCEADAASRGE